MSQQNVEVVRSGFEAWNAGDMDAFGADVVPLFRDDAAWTRWRTEIEALFEPDCVVVWIAHGQRAIEATGLDDSRQRWLDWLEPWETYHAQVERIIPAGDKVVALTRVHGRMVGTQHEVELIGASVYLVRDGTVARVEHYANRAQALEAVGLRE
jgi:ketosteroid isomerase-like protein